MSTLRQQQLVITRWRPAPIDSAPGPAPRDTRSVHRGQVGHRKQVSRHVVA